MKPIRIILHHSLTRDSGTVSWQAIRRYHTSYAHKGRIVSRDKAVALVSAGYHVKRPWSDIGYNFGIEQVNNRYEILAGRMMDRQGAHTRGKNRNSIGICCIGNFDNGPPSDEQRQMCRDLVKSLMRVFSIPASRVYGHNEFDSHKTCPGKYWDMTKFRRDL